MKKITILFCAAFALLLASCEKEETLNVEPIGSNYNLADDPNDPVQHFIYETYRDYGIVVITNPTEADYAYNFTNRNRLDVVAPPQEPAVLQAGIEFIKENFLDLYSADFKKTNMPFTILLAKSVVNKSFGGDAQIDAYASSGMLIVSNIDENIATLSEEQAGQYKAAINATFWSTYMGTVRHLFSVPDEFYQVSGGETGQEGDYNRYISEQRKEYDENWDLVPNPDYELYKTEEYWYSLGFADVIDYYLSEDPDPFWSDYDSYYYTTPGPTEDVDLWTRFIFMTPADEMTTICQTYEKMQQKYDILRQALEDAGCDLSLIVQ